MRAKLLSALPLFWLLLASPSSADVILLGDNLPFDNVNDGDFDLTPGWAIHQSPCWNINRTLSKDGRNAGVANGVFTSAGHPLTVVDSRVLDNIVSCTKLTPGDVLAWRFRARVEFVCNANASMSLVFGDHVRKAADSVPLPGNAAPSGVFQGIYHVTAEDADSGMPLVRIELSSEDHIKVFLEAVDLRVLDSATAGPINVKAAVAGDSIQLNWDSGLKHRIYRKASHQSDCKKLAENVSGSAYLDDSAVPGVDYIYFVTTLRDGKESSAVRSESVRLPDAGPPEPPSRVSAKGLSAEIELRWRTADKDVSHFVIYRDSKVICDHLRSSQFVDFLPTKGKVNSYQVQAVDFSGNKSELSAVVRAQVEAVPGASFSDLILPMPVKKPLRNDLWGAPNVLPRDAENGIEDSLWSYWGGRPVKGADGRYHLNVTRWPERGVKGHWEWQRSMIAYAVADKPTGPYTVVRDRAFEHLAGHGHNPDIIIKNDGTFLLYSYYQSVPRLYASDSIAGPWKYLGEIQIDFGPEHPLSEHYRYKSNWSAVQLDDGRFLAVSKVGSILRSEGTDPLGPYQILTGPIKGNPIIPKRYRDTVYEDPVMWKDDLQFHLIINAFQNYRAIYLRSPDGIHWKCDLGVAYTPAITAYEDGTQTQWYKLERPHVLTDTHGRATHLSLAVIDVAKRQDFQNDGHSSKNIILPLTVPRRLQMLNREPVNASTPQIRVLMVSESDFDPESSLDLDSLRFGASEEVNLGRGSKLIRTEKHADGLILVFAGAASCIIDDDFVCKLVGRSKDGKLIVGFSGLSVKNEIEASTE